MSDPTTETLDTAASLDDGIETLPGISERRAAPLPEAVP